MIKKSLLVAIISILLPALSLAGPWNGWIYQNPYPTSNTLLAVKFITPKKGWITGEKGTILYTEDGGDSWEYQENGTEEDLKSITFVNEKVGWAVGNGGVIIHTEDGGKKWERQGDIKASLHIVFFINEKDGWIGGVEGMLLHTTDGGKNWKSQKIGPWVDIAGIFFKDANTGWVLSGGLIFRTKDGGMNWDVSGLPDIRLPNGQFVKPIEHGWEGSVFFLNENKGFATVGLPYIFYTEDGGKTWQANKVSNSVDRIAFTGEKNGCVAASSILCTEDGGKTWKEQLGVRPGESDIIDGYMVALWGLSFADKSTGWAVGKDGQIWKTEDGGKNWKVKSGYNPFAYILDSKAAWGWLRNSLTKTEDGGKTWQVINQKTFAAPMTVEIFFINHTTGWAVGQETGRDRLDRPLILNYFILHTKDGGKTWITQFKEPGAERGISNELSDVFFINQDIGWVVGTNGFILHTKDGGKHWERQKSGTKSDIRKVQFIDDKKGWAIGNKVVEGSGKSIIMYTEDGGVHWRIQWGKKTDWMWLRDLLLPDEKTGWVMGDINEYSGDALLVYTNDGGRTWSEREFAGIYPAGISFLDKNRGAILTENKYTFITHDGGKTWEKKIKPLHSYPWHVSEIFKVQ